MTKAKQPEDPDMTADISDSPAADAVPAAQPAASPRKKRAG